MRKIIAAEFVTLDGVMEAPGRADTTLPELRGWSEPFMNQEIGATILGKMQNSGGFLLGRKTYADFAAFWTKMPADDPFASLMNSKPKYVVSTTLNKADWNNSTVIKGNIAEELARLKQQPGGDITIIGSCTLVQSLTKMGIIDEYQLSLCPVTLGAGKRLFSDGMKTFRLVETLPFDSGMVMLTYQPA